MLRLVSFCLILLFFKVPHAQTAITYYGNGRLVLISNGAYVHSIGGCMSVYSANGKYLSQHDTLLLQAEDIFCGYETLCKDSITYNLTQDGIYVIEKIPADCDKNPCTEFHLPGFLIRAGDNLYYSKALHRPFYKKENLAFSASKALGLEVKELEKRLTLLAIKQELGFY